MEKKHLEEKDFWSMSGDNIIRHHKDPRKSLFTPSPEDFPVPLKYVDVTRRTETDLESPSEKTIYDYWNMPNKSELSDSWQGRTIFTILRPRPPPGYTWIHGRLTKVQMTKRPPSIWPEVWIARSEKQKQHELEKWKKENHFLKRLAKNTVISR